MSILFDTSTARTRGALGRAFAQSPQFYSGQVPLLHRLLLWADKAKERKSLRALADNRRLLDDIGLSRSEALREAATPFWR